jgi:hypothetical protein
MKQKDMVIMGGVAIVAALFSIVLSGVIFGSPKKNPIKVPVVHKISSTFPTTQTDDYKSFLNDKALNPTQLIQIGNTNNKQPFQNE